MSNDRRRWPRVQVALRALCQEANGEVHEVDVHDLSPGGAYISGVADTEEGAEILLSLRLPPETEEVALKGRVIRRPPDAEPRQEGCGVEFERPEAVREMILSFFLVDKSGWTATRPGIS